MSHGWPLVGRLPLASHPAARSVATHTIDRAGHHLIEQSTRRPALAELVAGIRIGSTPRSTTIRKGAPT